MAEMDLNEILAYLKHFLSSLSDYKSNNTKPSSKTIPEFRGFQAPLKNWENSGNFSPGVATDQRHPNGHDGIDLRAPLGTNIVPIAPGKVSKVYEDPKGGLAAVIEHANGVSSYYAHLNSANVKPGDIVDYDTVIGTVGYSGNAHPSRGGGMPHVHLQTWINGALTNPGKFFPVKPYKPFDSQREALMLPGVRPRREPPLSSEKKLV